MSVVAEVAGLGPRTPKLSGLQDLPTLGGHLLGGLAQFELVGHFLEARSESFNLLLLLRDGRFLSCSSGL
jgi:hypothetical protein